MSFVSLPLVHGTCCWAEHHGIQKPIALFLCIMTHEMWINVCTHRSLFSCMNFVLSILFCTYSTIQLCSSNLTRFWLALIAFFWSGSHIHSPIFLNLNSAIIFILSMFRLFSFSLIIGRTCILNKMNAKLVLVYILIYFSFVLVFLF